eukprot:CAMPEP_0174755582 /NCGR_PEP_ID=MMETSP1094-20130205/106318_1 /TAXON_ID=156173 /ORGANISM="Chrysochromulina brevifilum, Strain UTEX LB 985" /LENGTH=115 /DNA_ID=CAMNT_0015961471 /DNA_START=692 /DNA_END=1039 /DNA_ORIENTATION=+
MRARNSAVSSVRLSMYTWPEVVESNLEENGFTVWPTQELGSGEAKGVELPGQCILPGGAHEASGNELRTKPGVLVGDRHRGATPHALEELPRKLTKGAARLQATSNQSARFGLLS